MSNQKRASSSQPNTALSATTSAKLRQVSSAKITFNTNDNVSVNLLNKEEEYKRLNAELERKTATLVFEAEQVLKANEKLINEADYLNRISDVNFLNNESIVKPNREKSNIFENMNELASFKHTISNYEKDENLDEDTVLALQTEAVSQLIPRSANDMSSEAQIRFLKAKLKVMQEELERFQFEMNKKEEENLKLAQRCKDLDEDRAKQIRISNSHQTQLDKFKKQNDDLQVKLNAQEIQLQSLKKENDQFKKDTKKQQTDQQQLDLRLNRALEEIDKYKQQIAKNQSSSKDSNDQEKRRIEQLQSDNKRLQKQKLELIQAFKKQLKLIDILKKQKMHLEAAKMLQFSEEEFLNALEWNNNSGPTNMAPSINTNNKNGAPSKRTGSSNLPTQSAQPTQPTHQNSQSTQQRKNQSNDDIHKVEEKLPQKTDEQEENEYGDDQLIYGYNEEDENNTPMYNNVLLDDEEDENDY